MDGELRHDPDDGLIEGEYADAYMSDVIVAVTFINPYSAASNNWDYGFIIRDEGGSGRQIHIEVTSRRQWFVSWRSNGRDANTSQEIASGRINNFDTRAGGRNDLAILAAGSRGLLFVNGEFISMLDLSAHTGPGDIAVATGLFTDGEVSGAVTHFEDFLGEPLAEEYGPASGSLEYSQKYISLHKSGVWTRDFVAEAQFTNPSGNDWDYGFTFRHPESNRLEVIAVTDNNLWVHKTREAGDNEYTTLADGLLQSVSFRNTNHLLLFVFDDIGYFFVNEQLITLLDLSHNFDYGDVSAMGGFFNDHTGEPQFRNFNVWAID